MKTYIELTEQLEEQNAQKVKLSEFFMRVWAAARAAHLAHLMTSSFAAHSALNEFYTGIIPLLDGVMESAIARIGRLETLPANVNEKAFDGLQIVGNLTAWIDQNRALISQNSEIQNKIDEILDLCNTTSYKLRELR